MFLFFCIYFDYVAPNFSYKIHHIIVIYIDIPPVNNHTLPLGPRLRILRHH